MTPKREQKWGLPTLWGHIEARSEKQRQQRIKFWHCTGKTTMNMNIYDEMKYFSSWYTRGWKRKPNKTLLYNYFFQIQLTDANFGFALSFNIKYFVCIVQLTIMTFSVYLRKTILMLVGNVFFHRICINKSLMEPLSFWILLFWEFWKLISNFFLQIQTSFIHSFDESCNFKLKMYNSDES